MSDTNAFTKKAPRRKRGGREENLTPEYTGIRARIKEILYLIGSHEILPAAMVTAILRFFRLEGA
jgi:hypothetical protein